MNPSPVCKAKARFSPALNPQLLLVFNTAWWAVGYENGGNIDDALLILQTARSVALGLQGGHMLVAFVHSSQCGMSLEVSVQWSVAKQLQCVE